MRCRQPLAHRASAARPRHRHAALQPWLVSDARNQHRIVQIARRIPVGGGLLMRPDALARGALVRQFRALRAIAAGRALTVQLSVRPALARRLGAAGVHVRHGAPGDAAIARRLGLRLSMPVHGPGEAAKARRAGAALWFVSPLFATRSHPGGKPLPMQLAAQLAAAAAPSGVSVLALGGMTGARARMLARRMKLAGWAAIDAWDQVVAGD